MKHSKSLSSSDFIKFLNCLIKADGVIEVKYKYDNSMN